MSKDHFAEAGLRFRMACNLGYPLRLLLTVPPRSGKTTFCRSLMEQIPEATLVVSNGYPRGPREIGAGAICARQFGPVIIDDIWWPELGPRRRDIDWVFGALLCRLRPLSPILWVQSGPVLDHRLNRWTRMRIAAQRKNGRPIFEHMPYRYLREREAQIGKPMFDRWYQGKL